MTLKVPCKKHFKTIFKNLGMYIIPERPPIIISDSVKNFNICTRNTADWSVPAVSYSSIKIPCVETFKIRIKGDKTLKKNKTKKGRDSSNL